MILAYFIFNIIAFALYFIDKAKAKKNRWRISENTLIISAFLGAIGAFLAMSIFHHKTKHIKFKILIPIFLLLHISVILYIIYYGKIQ